MGVCATTSKRNEYNEEIEKQLIRSQRVEHRIKKIVLMGTHSSGKSTLLKQLNHIHAWGDDPEKLKQYAHVIRNNIISAMLLLLHKSYELYTIDSSRFKNILDVDNDYICKAVQYVLYAESQFSMTEKKSHKLVFGYIGDYENKTKIFIPSDIPPMILTFYYSLFEQQHNEMQRLGTFMKMLWNSDAVQTTFAARGNLYSFPDNMDYYFDNVTYIFSTDFEPNQEDRLKCDYPYNESVEETYEINENYFDILCYDNGCGGKVNSKKWMIFENVSAVIFVAALNHYNTVSFTNNNKNAMHESIELFGEIVNCKWFRKSDVILFLNKNDLFTERLRKQHSLRECFHIEHGWEGDQWDISNDYEPQNDIREDQQLFDKCHQVAINFIQDQYIKRNQNRFKWIFVHICNATSSDNIQRVFWDVQNIVIHANLKRGGS